MDVSTCEVFWGGVDFQAVNRAPGSGQTGGDGLVASMGTVRPSLWPRRNHPRYCPGCTAAITGWAHGTGGRRARLVRARRQSSGQRSGEGAGGEHESRGAELPAEAMPRRSPRVDAGPRRSAAPRHQHGNRRRAATRRPREAGAVPGSDCLPEGRGGDTRPPRVRTARLSGEGSPSRADRAW